MPQPPPLESACGETSESEVDIKPGLPRSQSERLIAAYRDHVTQERELRERFHEAVYNTAEKVLRASQSGQLKMLRVSNN